MYKFILVLLLVFPGLALAQKTQLMQEDVSYVNPLKYGTSLNATTLQGAITAIGSSNRTLFLSTGAWSLSANVTVPSNIFLLIPTGTTVAVAGGFTLTINGMYEASTKDWYTGTVVFNNIPLREPESFNAFFTDFVHTGGYHPANAGLTSAAFSTSAWIDGHNITEPSRTITYSASATDVCWTIISRNTTTIATWTQVASTHYFYKCTGTLTVPTLPALSQYLMGPITITTSNIAQVVDRRNRIINTQDTIADTRTISGTWILQYGTLSISPGVTATFTIPPIIMQPSRQVFFNTGQVVFANNATVYPQWFGVIGDGTTVDRDPMQRTFNASKDVHIPTGTYYMGAFGAGVHNMIDLSNLGDGITITVEGDVEFTCQSTASIIPVFFYLHNNSHFTVHGTIQFKDLGFDPTITWKGAAAFFLSNNPAVNWGDINIESIYCTNMVVCFQISGAGVISSTNRVSSIHIGHMTAIEGYYGFLSVEQGDAVVIDLLDSYHNYRAFYSYGVSGQTVSRLRNRNNRASSGMVLLARQIGGLNTKGITIHYTGTDMVNTSADTAPHIVFEHLDLLGGEISNIHIDIDIRNDPNVNSDYFAVRMINYDGSGNETTAASLNTIRDVYFTGSCDTSCKGITVKGSYLNKAQQMSLQTGLNFLPDQTVYNAFQLNLIGRNVTPITWLSITGTPGLGNGTLEYHVDIVHGMAFLTAHLVFGTTTTPGTGLWTFTNFNAVNGGAVSVTPTPLIATAPAIGSVWAVQTGVAFHIGTCRVLAGAVSVKCYAENTSGFSGTVPFTWAPTDEMYFTIAIPLS